MSAQFNNPRGIAVGNIIVADTGNRAIREVASNGSVKTLVLYDEKGRKFEGFKEPTDVAVDAEGRIVVADSKARRLWVIENGVAKVLWQTQRKDCAPVSLAIDQEGRVIFLPKAMAGCLMKLETKQIAPGLNSFTYKSRCMENDIFSRLLAGLVRRDTTSISKKNITLLKDSRICWIFQKSAHWMH